MRMKKIRIKILTANEEKKEVGRVLYVPEGPIKQVYDIMNHITTFYLPYIGVEGHAIYLTDSKGYAIGGWISSNEVLDKKRLNVYVCIDTCQECTNKYYSDEIYEHTDEEIEMAREQYINERQLFVEPPKSQKQPQMLHEMKRHMQKNDVHNNIPEPYASISETSSAQREAQIKPGEILEALPVVPQEERKKGLKKTLERAPVKKLNTLFRKYA